MLTSRLLIVIPLVAELISGQSHRDLIPDISSPQQVIWKDINHVIFVKTRMYLSLILLRRH